MTPISFPNPDSEIIIQNLNRDLMNQSVYLHSTISTLQKDSNINESLAESIRDSAYEKMCEKLAVISVDLIKRDAWVKRFEKQNEDAGKVRAGG